MRPGSKRNVRGETANTAILLRILFMHSKFLVAHRKCTATFCTLALKQSAIFVSLQWSTYGSTVLILMYKSSQVESR